MNEVYNDPILTKKRKGNHEDPFNQIEESLSVINTKVVLSEIPNRFHRVKVKDGNDFLFEIQNGIPNENQFIVDYVQGVVTFHPSRNNSTLTFIYLGEGVPYFPAARIWTKKDANNVIETLQEFIDIGNQKIEQATEKINEVQQAIINANNATADYTTIVNQTKKIYKGLVNTYADIATTFPSPEVGWTVVAKDTKIEWRYNGTFWESVGMSDVVDGFAIIAGSSPPANTNTIWLDTSDTNGYLRVYPSSTPPTNTNFIWWQTD